MAITQQEAWARRDGAAVRVPEIVAEVVERVAFEARQDKRVDRRAGVSQRLPITVLENVVSNAERRAAAAGEPMAVPRLADVYAALPSITGKIELEYEGELVGAAAIARELILRAADATFRARGGDADTDPVIAHFDAGGALEVGDDARTATMLAAFETVPGLLDAVREGGLATADDEADTVVGCELVLEALAARKKISRAESGRYGRATPERRRRPGQDPFEGGLGL
jgi:magnesium chelatase subunit I